MVAVRYRRERGLAKQGGEKGIERDRERAGHADIAHAALHIKCPGSPQGRGERP